MISEVLFLLIKHVCDAKLIQGIRLAPGGTLLLHLIFADDTLLFLKANEQNGNNITRIFHDFCHASGQQVSLEKSSVYFSPNAPEPIRSSLSELKASTPLTAGRETLIKVVALAEFNLALLEKQCWRFLHKPNTLWAQVASLKSVEGVEIDRDQ
ncbi:PREDICTED: reverse mRNAase [Prunus dulcis]|uniref:PREDICTED: reverse mRNAase n=1 Tax=Prunus dulcis TaxID=3755 RepID=A0A5E4G1D7_PRUDU|nr:PREDICTED: reverse mRNAase [Prunus dulcis]